MSEPVIVTEALRRTFGKKDDVVEAVAGVDLRVEAGTIFGFLGPNGAGKTTTLRILATLLPPTSGVARVAGLDVATQAPDVRRRIGYVAQTGGTDPRMSGRGELVMQGRLFGLSGSRRPRAGRRAPRRARARGRRPTAPSRPTPAACAAGSTSALGIVHRPVVLFLDEPTTGLDPQARARMWDEVRQLRDGGHDRVPHHPLPRGGRRPVRPPRDHRPRPDRRRGHRRRAQARDRRRRGHDRRRRRPRSACSALLEAQPFVREAAIADGAHPPLRRPTARRACRRPPPARRPGPRARRRSSLHRPSLDDVFLRQTGRSLRGRRHDRESTSSRPSERTLSMRMFHDTWLVFRALARPHRPAARPGSSPAWSSRSSTSSCSARCSTACRRRAGLPGGRRVQRVRARPARHDRACSARLRRLRPSSARCAPASSSGCG